MSATKERESGKRLLWATASGTVERGVLDSAAEFDLHVQVCAPQEVAGLLRSGGDLVGIELAADPSNGIAAIRELHTRSPGIAIIAASANADVELMRAAMQAGACDLLTLPLSAQELHKALLRLTQTVSRAPAAAASGEVITVYGVRGGLGATTLAVNLGFKIGTVTGADTAVVDRDHAMPGGEPIDDPRVEIVENRAPMVEKDEWHASAGTDVAIGKSGPCSTDRKIRRIDIAHNRSGLAGIIGHHFTP